MDRVMDMYTDIHLATGILGMGPGRDLDGEEARVHRYLLVAGLFSSDVMW
jgi:hypothetical protein